MNAATAARLGSAFGRDYAILPLVEAIVAEPAFTSDAAGNPALSVPFLAPAESVAQIAIPGTSSGRISANSVMDLHGIDVAVVANIARINGWSFDYLWGFRYLYLNDDFAFNQSITALVDNGVFFNGAGQVWFP